MKKAILPFSIFLLVLTAGWLYRYEIAYHYDVWRMEHSSGNNEKSRYGNKIQSLWDKTWKSCFADTYNDTTKKVSVRRVAATALIKADAALAETVFGKHIDSSNSDVSGLAIRDLGIIKSRKFRDAILRKISSSNDLIRWSVVDYLGHFGDPESVKMLAAVRDGDRSEMVRNAASDKLRQLSKNKEIQQSR